MILSSVTNIGGKLEWFSSERGRNGDVTLYTFKSASYRHLIYMYSLFCLLSAVPTSLSALIAVQSAIKLPFLEKEWIFQCVISM